MKAPGPAWAHFLLTIAKGETGDIQDWRDLGRRFGITLTDDIAIAQSFFCLGRKPHDPFPPDRSWICATNRLAKLFLLALN
jgi:hypothetical protein